MIVIVQLVLIMNQVAYKWLSIFVNKGLTRALLLGQMITR